MSLSRTLLALALSGAALSAHADISYSATIGKLPSGAAAAATVITFDNSLLPSGFASYDKAAAIMPGGGHTGTSAPPPDDRTPFFSVGVSDGQPTASTVTFGGLGASYFGFYMGSPDNYNVVTLYSGNTEILQINGNHMAIAANLHADGNQLHGFYMNFNTTAGTTISRVTFSSTSNAFETDNHAYIAAVPEPESYAMLLAGLGLVGLASRRRRPANEECFY